MQSTGAHSSTFNSEAQPYTHNDNHTYTAGRYAKVLTIEQAKQEVYELFDEQLKKALEERTEPNKKTYGDSRAKEAFWILLSPDEQRDVFINFWRRRAFWPRVRGLVGIPPFSFLKPGDNGMLNASGIAGNRQNMSYAVDGAILSSSEIGSGHFIDDYGRIYKLLKTDNFISTNVIFRRINSSKKIVFECKLPRMATANRIAIHKRRSRDADSVQKITFPRTGQTLTLTLASLLSENPKGETYRVVVRGVVPREKSSPVCRVFAETRL